MSRRRRPENRCPECLMRQDLCYCEQIVPTSCATRLEVIMHRFEEGKPTNTVRPLRRALPATAVHMFGGIGDKPQLDHLLGCEGRALVLFPADDASILSPEYVSRLTGPVTLIVPDGTWHQAKKIAGNRNLALRELEKVRLPEAGPTSYGLRESPVQNGLCTLEAVARALGILEGPAIQQQLESLLAVLVQRVLWSRRTSAPFESPAVGMP